MNDTKHRTTIVFKGKALDIVNLLQNEGVTLNSIISSLLIQSLESGVIFDHTGVELGLEKNKELIRKSKKLVEAYKNTE